MLLQRILSAAVLAGLLAALPATAAAHDPPLEAGPGMILDAGPDGTYAVPLAGGDPVPLEFAPGEAPLRLVALAFDPRRQTLDATLQNAGEAPVSAWAVELATYSASGEVLASSRLTRDQYPGAGDALDARAGAPRLHAPMHEQGLFHSGQMHREPDLGIALPAAAGAAPPGRLVLSTPVVVFADTSFAGSPALARDILADRKAAADELAYWTVRLEELAERAASDEEALAGLVALREELDRGSADLTDSARLARANLASNLDPVIEQARRRPGSGRAELRDLSTWLAGELAARARHVPRELPEVPAAPEDGDGEGDLRERVFGEEDPQINCDCGGSIYSSASRSEIRDCFGTSTGWRVNESWSYSCRDENGMTLSTGGGLLNGVGGCLEAFCYPSTYCPPQFSPPSETEDRDFHYWNRVVLNQAVLFGMCTARCSATDSSSLSIMCPCSPAPQPRCEWDGCPILIETGASGYELTDLAGGVHFDLDADGAPERVSWPAAGGDDAWLALDRDGNGAIDDGGELFGNSTRQPASAEPNGFLALAVFDRPAEGGDGDGQITAGDRVFRDLVLWLDRDHDGASAPSELVPLDRAGIVAIELEYHESRRRDRYGNEFRYAARVWLASGARRLAQDVFLLFD